MRAIYWPIIASICCHFSHWTVKAFIVSLPVSTSFPPSSFFFLLSSFLFPLPSFLFLQNTAKLNHNTNISSLMPWQRANNCAARCVRERESNFTQPRPTPNSFHPHLPTLNLSFPSNAVQRIHIPATHHTNPSTRMTSLGKEVLPFMQLIGQPRPEPKKETHRSGGTSPARKRGKNKAYGRELQRHQATTPRASKHETSPTRSST